MKINAASRNAIPRLSGMHYALMGISFLVVAGLFRTEILNVFRDPGHKNTAALLKPGKGGDDTEKSVSDIVNDAATFYNLLSASQQTTLQLTYSTTLARKWSNLPCGAGCRNGLQLGTNLTSAQYSAAMKVISDALSSASNNGYDEFHQMNMAEAYLHANGGGNNYDSTLRWIAFLNTPTATGPWMLQFGGHHYAANIAFNNGHVIGATPFFMGLEPKTFTYNSVAYDPLGDERTAFADALSSLSSAQLSTATISSSFSDCVMIPGETNGGTSTFPSVSIGQPLSSLTQTQKDLVMSVIEKYTGDIDNATGAYMNALYEGELSQTYLSFHGSGTSGSSSSFLVAQGDYARISGPHVWIEFSCQGGVVIQGQIHYHTVWRDRVHDYGVDLSGDAIDNTVAGLAENSLVKNITLYPNPATDKVSVKLPEAAQNATVICMDNQGKMVLKTSGVSGEKIDVGLTSLAKGNYQIFIFDGEKTYRGKFIRM